MEVKAEKNGERGSDVAASFLAILECDQRRLVRLCAALERLADELPVSKEDVKTPRLLIFLNRAFERHIFLHEKCLFPLVRSLTSANAPCEPILAQLEYEHASDQALVHEITSAFLDGSGYPTAANICLLGYLLRSFFEGVRRHHAWEKNILYPMARDLLTDGAAIGQHRALLRISLGLVKPDS